MAYGRTSAYGQVGRRRCSRSVHPEADHCRRYHHEATNSGGVMAGYRFNLKNWLAVEGDYDYFSTTSVPMNVHSANWCCHCEASVLQDACREDRVSVRARGRRGHVL